MSDQTAKKNLQFLFTYSYRVLRTITTTQSLLELDTQSVSLVQLYVTALHEWISRMHELRLTALALRCSIRATATEMVAIAP